MKKSNFIVAALLSILSMSGVAKADEAIDFANLKVGDVIKLGHFEQDGNADNGAEAIEWQIVFVKGKKVLALAKDNLELYNFQPEYKMPSTAIQEAFLTLRAWAKKDFSKAAFNKDEKAHVKESFILSQKEVEKMVPAQFRAAKASAAVKAKGAKVSDNGNCRWWLSDNSNAYTGKHGSIDANGNLDEEAWLFKNKESCIRPAIWLKL